MKNICIFCGSSMGKLPAYRETAARLAGFMTGNNYNMIYGGANVGLMKILADKMLEAGKTEVIGIMPRHLVDREVAHEGITKMHIVESMSERKNLMVKLSDCFLALPGGFGTLDEMAEVITYNQLRLTDKPLGILNINGYFDHLLAFFDHAVQQNFLRKEHYDNLIVDNDIENIFKRLESYQPVSTSKWIHDIRRESLNDK